MKNEESFSYSRYKRNNSPLHQKSFQFSVRVVNMVKYLWGKNIQVRKLLDQVLRSGTSISANIRESEFAQSPADFVNKLHIALKEANETEHWLEIFKESNTITPTQYQSLYEDCEELIAMLISSINTTKRKNNL